MPRRQVADHAGGASRRLASGGLLQALSGKDRHWRARRCCRRLLRRGRTQLRRLVPAPRPLQPQPLRQRAGRLGEPCRLVPHRRRGRHPLRDGSGRRRGSHHRPLLLLPSLPDRLRRLDLPEGRAGARALERRGLHARRLDDGQGSEHRREQPRDDVPPLRVLHPQHRRLRRAERAREVRGRSGGVHEHETRGALQPGGGLHRRDGVHHARHRGGCLQVPRDPEHGGCRRRQERDGVRGAPSAWRVVERARGVRRDGRVRRERVLGVAGQLRVDPEQHSRRVDAVRPLRPVARHLQGDLVSRGHVRGVGGGEPGGQSLQRVRVADGLRRDESGLLGVRSFGERGGLHDDAGADGAGGGGPSAQDVVDRAGHRGVPRVQVRDRHRAVGVDAERQLLRVLQGDGRRVSGHRGVPARERGSDIAGEVWIRFPRLFVQRVSRRRAG